MVISTIASSLMVTVVINLIGPLRAHSIIDCAMGTGGRRCTESSASLTLV